MASGVPGKQQRQLVLGNAIMRTAALTPQTAYGALFNILGGKVLVTGFVGEVVVALPATANTAKVTGTPTVGTAVDWSTATSIASAQVGSVITLPVAAAGALVVNNAGAGNLVFQNGFVAQVGTLGLTTSGSSATGTVRWTLTYIPLDDGASVSAA